MNVDEGTTIDDLLAWANGLGICTFRKRAGFHGDEIVCDGDGGTIDMHLGRFSESVPVHGGKRAVSVGFEYKANPRPWDGMGYMSCDLGKIARDVERYAERMGLLDPQMTLF